MYSRTLIISFLRHFDSYFSGISHSHSITLILLLLLNSDYSLSLTIHCDVIVVPVDFLELMKSAFDIIVEEEDILLNKWENNMTITMALLRR